MTIKKTIISEFEKRYVEAYKGILSDEVLQKGNPWFVDFLSTSAIDRILDEAIGRVGEANEPELIVDGINYNTRANEKGLIINQERARVRHILEELKK